MEVKELEKYFSKMSLGSIMIEIRHKTNSNMPTVIRSMADVLDFNDLIRIIDEFKKNNRLEFEVQDLIDDFEYMSIDIGKVSDFETNMYIVFKNPNGIHLDKLEKDYSKSFIDQFEYMIMNVRGMHKVSLDTDYNVTELWLDARISNDDYPSRTFIWHPDTIKSMKENDEFFIADCPRLNIKDGYIAINGYKPMIETDSYYTFEEWETNSIAYRLVDKKSGFDDYLYNIHDIVIKEKLAEIPDCFK